MSGNTAEPTPRGSRSSTSLGDVDGPALRPGSSVAVGVVAGLAGLALLVPCLLAAQRNWAMISSIVLALVLVWLFVVRPSARLHTDGLRLVNPMRVVEVTWPAIDEVRSKWALEVLSGGKKYTAWGVPADPKRPRYGRELLTLGLNKSAPGDESRKPKVEAQTVAVEVEARRVADSKRKDGRTPVIALQSWDPLAVGLLVAALAFFVIAVFIA